LVFAVDVALAICVDMGSSIFVQVILLALLFVHGYSQCRDQDEVIGPLLEEQFGRPLTCEQLLRLSGNACDDETVRELCCAQCSAGSANRAEVVARLVSKQAIAQAQLARAPRLPLRGGGSMPPIALGTAGLSGPSGSWAVEYALRSGYRALDTAVMYGNHGMVGEGLRASGVPRESVFLISKIPPEMQGYDRAADAVPLMLSEMQTPYVDLCLIHWPSVASGSTNSDAFVVVERAGTWRALERARDRGDCRHIGVSNYMRPHLEELLDIARFPPEVNQIEFHPHQVDDDTFNLCKRYGIAVQAYGSIASAGLLQEPAVLSASAALSRSPAQVLLRWALQMGAMVLPRSTKEARILENAMLWDFELSPSQLHSLSILHTGHRTYGDPHSAPAGVFKVRRPWSRFRAGGRNASLAMNV